jgi:hypothetical protein
LISKETLFQLSQITALLFSKSIYKFIKDSRASNLLIEKIKKETSNNNKKKQIMMMRMMMINKIMKKMMKKKNSMMKISRNNNLKNQRKEVQLAARKNDIFIQFDFLKINNIIIFLELRSS